MSTITLVCSCGMRMKAPGAVPGRVGKCPRCGSFLKVPDKTGSGTRNSKVPDPVFSGTLKVPEEDSAKPAPGPEPATKAPIARPATFVKHRSKSLQGATPRRKSDGFVAPPRMAETRFVDSLLYPLWNASGIALLAFMPPLLWFCTAPMFVILGTIDNASLSVIGFVFLVPQIILMLSVGGYILLFLGQVLVTSSLGEVAQPRSPGWDISEIGEGLGRWFWALLIGGVVGGLPALTYWITCGEIDLFDKIVLVDLLVPGMAYAQMGLLATLIHESPLAANPVTVTRSIIRLGWSYVAPCAETAAVVVVMSGLFAGVLRIKSPIGQSVACWLFWSIALYVSMVLLRRLGLYCYRNAVVLDWFPERSRPAP